jgi:hypothetical protein
LVSGQLFHYWSMKKSNCTGIFDHFLIIYCQGMQINSIGDSKRTFLSSDKWLPVPCCEDVRDRSS